MNAPEEDDLLAALGVVLPTGAGPKRAPVEAGHKPPKKAPVRFTDWSNAATFTFGGYVARTRRLRCGACEGVTDLVEGIFIEEIHLPSGTRRLQQMVKGAQWPTGGGHRQEIWEEGVEVCAGCVAALGFDRLVDGKGEPLALVKREGEELLVRRTVANALERGW